MFTGIVEETGAVRAVRRGAKSSVLSIQAEQVLSDLKIGDSVAVSDSHQCGRLRLHG